MTKLVLTNASVVLGGNDISSSVSSVTINYGVDTQDGTAMGDTTKGMLPSLKTYSLELELFNDYTDNAIDELLFAMIGDAAGTTWAVKPKNTTVSANNPLYSGTGVVTGSQPVTGGVGDVAKTKVSLVPFAGTAMTRAVA